jgi:hypothetical protein
MKRITYLETAEEIIDAFRPAGNNEAKDVYIDGNAYIDSSHGGELILVGGPDDVEIKGVEVDQLIQAMAKKLNIRLE